MPIKLNDSVQVNANRNTDAKKDVYENGLSRPFSSIEEFLSIWPVQSRYEGQIVPVKQGNDIIEYWSVGGVSSLNYKIKPSGGQLDTPSDVSFIIT